MTIAVVGGGISGLTVAHALSSRGREVVVLEAQARAGGLIRSEREDGFLLEWGPNSLLDREPALRTLVEALGLSGRLVSAQPAVKRRFVYTRGALRALPGSPPAFVKSDVLPLGARLRVVGELFSSRAKPGEDESLASFARRHLGRAATETLVDAMQTGIYAGDPEKQSVAAVFPQLVKMEREHRSLLLALIRGERQRRKSPPPPSPLTGAVMTFDGGLGTLVRALEEALGPAVQRGVALQGLSREGTRWRLSLARGGAPETLVCDEVVLSTPAYVSAEAVRPLDTALAEELSGIRYAPIAVVHLGYARADAESVPDGFGYLIPEREGENLLGCIFASSVFPFRAPDDGVLLSCMVGGARHPERVALSEEALVTLAREAVQKQLGLAAAPRHARAIRWPRGIPQYELGHLARLERIDARLAGLPGLHLTGNAYKGVGVNDCVRNALALAERIAPGKA